MEVAESDWLIMMRWSTLSVGLVADSVTAGDALPVQLIEGAGNH